MNNGNNSNIIITVMDNSNTTSMTTPNSPKRNPEAIGGLYKAAARRLREYHGVPSMTAVDLRKTLALLQLQRHRLVAQGLAPSKLLRSESPPLLPAKESLGGAEGEECETAVAGKRVRDDNFDRIDIDYSENETETSTAEKEDNKTSDDSESGKEDASNTKDRSEGDATRPVHTALLAGGVNLRPRETAPLLRALGVSTHRLVRLGLVKRCGPHAVSGGRGRCAHKQHRCGGYRRAGGMSGPHSLSRHVSLDGPPHGPLGRGPSCGETRRRPPPLRRGHGYCGDFGEQPHWESEGDEECMPMYGPPDPSHGPDRHCPHHHGEGKMGKAHGPPHGSPDAHGRKRARMHHGPGLLDERSHDEESGGEEIIPMHEGPPGPPQGRARRRHHGSPMAGGGGGMPPHVSSHGLFHEGAVNAPHGRMECPGHGPPRRGGRFGRGGGVNGGGSFCGGEGINFQPGRMGHHMGSGVDCGPCPLQQKQEAY